MCADWWCVTVSSGIEIFYKAWKCLKQDGKQLKIA